MKTRMVMILAALMMLTSFDADAQRDRIRPSSAGLDDGRNFFHGLGVTF